MPWDSIDKWRDEDGPPPPEHPVDPALTWLNIRRCRIEQDGTRLVLFNPMIAPGPPGESYSMLAMHGMVIFPDGERREQTVFICDLPDAPDWALADAFWEGWDRHEPTVQRRLLRKDRGDITPQSVFTPVPIRTAMSRLGA
jgi:hypothetical protein